MEATLYSLDDMRSRRATAITIAKTFPTSNLWAGLAPLTVEMMLHALSFWGAYGDAMASFHARLLSSVSSPCLKQQTKEAHPCPW